jgi:hypothetical protein
MSYQSIDGILYEKELLDLAEQLTSGRGEYKISKEEVLQLFESTKDGKGTTDTERRTLLYIKEKFPFTEAAMELFNEMI